MSNITDTGYRQNFHCDPNIFSSATRFLICRQAYYRFPWYCDKKSALFFFYQIKVCGRGQMVISEISKYLKLYETPQVFVIYSRIRTVCLANLCGIVNGELRNFLNNWGQIGNYIGNDSKTVTLCLRDLINFLWWKLIHEKRRAPLYWIGYFIHPN